MDDTKKKIKGAMLAVPSSAFHVISTKHDWRASTTVGGQGAVI